MPLYDYQCSKEHQFEAYTQVEQQQLPCRGEGCGEVAERIFSAGSGVGIPRNAQGFPTVVYHVDAAGRKRFPGRADALVPKGFRKVELSDIRAIRKFEREVSKEERAKQEKRLENEERYFEQHRKERRAELRREAQHFSQFGRDFARFAMEQNLNRREKVFDPGFNVEAFK